MVTTEVARGRCDGVSMDGNQITTGFLCGGSHAHPTQMRDRHQQPIYKAESEQEGPLNRNPFSGPGEDNSKSSGSWRRDSSGGRARAGDLILLALPSDTCLVSGV